MGMTALSPCPLAVYKVKLVDREETPSHDNYIMKVLSVIKMGTTTVGRGQGHLGARGGKGHQGGGQGHQGG